MNIKKLDSGLWQYRWRDPSGRQKKQSFARKSDAEAFALSIEGGKRSGSYVDPHDKTTVAEYAKKWTASRSYRPRTVRRIREQLSTHVEPTAFGRMRLASVRPTDVQQWASERTTLGPRTLHELVGFVRSVFQGAVEDNLITRNPVTRKISLPKVPKKKVVPLTPEQVDALADAVPARNRAMIYASVGLGPRPGELCALRVQDINFLQHEASVEDQIDRYTHRRVDPKTVDSRRTIELPEWLADILAAHLAEFPPGENGLIFTTMRSGPKPGGGPYSADSYGDLFRKAKAKAGLPFATPKLLRHTFASWMAAEGRDAFQIAAALGHTSAQLVYQTYGHLMPNQKGENRRAMERAYARREQPPSLTSLESRKKASGSG